MTDNDIQELTQLSYTPAANVSSAETDSFG